MTGARSFAAIGEYARDKGRLVLDTLGADGAVAHSATIRLVLVGDQSRIARCGSPFRAGRTHTRCGLNARWMR